MIGGRRARVLVAPEDSTAKQKQQREDREFGSGDALLAAVAVVPGECQGDGEADQQQERCELLQPFRPVERRDHIGQTLQQAPGTGRIGNAPLHHLAAAEALPGAVALPFRRRIGHARVPPPWA